MRKHIFRPHPVNMGMGQTSRKDGDGESACCNNDGLGDSGRLSENTSSSSMVCERACCPLR